MSVLTLNQQLRNGLSNARNSSQYDNINGSVNNGASLFRGGGSILGTDLTRQIEAANQSSEGLKPSFQFPTDMPKYHFRLLENNWSIGSRGLSIERSYTLPLPMQGIQDDFSVNYDTDYSPVSEVIKAGSAVAGVLQAASQAATELLGTAARGVSAVSGRTLNTFKTVTFAAPDFREFSLSWKLSPKTYEEAQSIQKIYWGLRRGMTPESEGASLVFRFPRIYTMYFVPNVKYLYKFKPCVLRNLIVNFTGGNPHPTFYKRQVALSESPPESVIMTMTFLELEYWTQQDIDDPGKGNTDANGLPSNNPFDVWNWYAYNTNNNNPITT